MITSDTSVFATSFSADICAGSWPCSTHDRNSSDKRSRSAPRRISVSAVGADADPHDRQLGVLAAPRVQDLVERGLARAVGRDTGTRAADVVARRDQHHAVLGQMGKCGAQHVVGADGVDGERVHPRRHIGVLDVGEGNRGAGEDHGVKTAERLGGLADDLADRRGVLHVQFEGGAADGVGQLGQPVHPPRRYGDFGARARGALRDGVADARRGADHEEPQACGVHRSSVHVHCPSFSGVRSPFVGGRVPGPSVVLRRCPRQWR